MLNIGPQELILVLIIALVVVGPSRLPELGRTIGRALREFRKVQDEVKDTFRFDMSDHAPTGAPPRPHAPRGGASDGAPGDGATPADAGAPSDTSPVEHGPAAPAPAPAGDASQPDARGPGTSPETPA
jgi:Tat protein translocase TatB subunit